jgi:hypothetical protein
MDADSYVAYCARIEEHLLRAYSVRIVTRDIQDPLTGDLDGSEIDIDYLVGPDLRLFLLAHLFGHTVQWNVNPRAFEIGGVHEPPVDEALLPEILAYEHEAACYGLALFHEVGITDCDQWLSDFTACDLAYLLHYYRTGEKLNSLSFWCDGAPLIQPMPIPKFTPRKRIFRRDGIVI